jgi:hypothetical protein
VRPWQRLAIIGIISCAYVIWNISVLNIKGKINKIAIILFSRTIHKFLKRIWERGNIENFPRSRGRRQMTPRDDRILFRSVKTNRRQTLKDVKARFNQRTSCNVFFVSSLKSICDHWSTLQCNFRRQNATRRWRLIWEIVIFLDTTLRLYPPRNNLLQTVLDETLQLVLWLNLAVTSFRVCRLFVFTLRKRILSSRGVICRLPLLRGKFSMFPLSPEIALESRSVVAYTFQWWDKDNTWAKSLNLCLEKG